MRDGPHLIPIKNLTLVCDRNAARGDNNDDGGDNDEIAKTRLFINYDVELEITDQNNLSIESFDPRFLTRPSTRCLSLAKTSKELSGTAATATTTTTTTMNMTTRSLSFETVLPLGKTAGDQQFLGGGPPRVPQSHFPRWISRAWTAYVMLYQKAVFRIFGINGPMFQQGSVYARETEFDLAVVTRSDVD